MSRKIATLSASVPAIHANQQALEDDQTGASVQIEQARFTRRMLDFEVAVQHERDRLHAEHHEMMRGILLQDEAAAE